MVVFRMVKSSSVVVCFYCISMFDCLLMFMTVVVLMNLDDNAKVDEDCEDDDAQDEEEAIGAPWPAPLTNPPGGPMPFTF